MQEQLQSAAVSSFRALLAVAAFCFCHADSVSACTPALNAGEVEQGARDSFKTLIPAMQAANSPRIRTLRDQEKGLETASRQLIAVEELNGEWFVETAEQTGHAESKECLQQEALIVSRGTHIIHNAANFRDGAIEFDVSPLDSTMFIGIVFRRESSQDYENIYLRPTESGTYQAMQYAPRINNSPTWQIYPEFMTTINIPRNFWTHVRIEVAGSSAKVFVNQTLRPVLVIERLRSNSEAGSIAVWGYNSSTSLAPAAAFANFHVEQVESPTTNNSTEVGARAAGTLIDWEVAAPIAADELVESGEDLDSLPQLDDWKPMQAEESGLVT